MNNSGSVELQFENVVSGQPLILGDTYFNAFGEDFKVTKFKYYITNIEFLNTVVGTHEKIANSYFLVDEQDALSKQITVLAPVGTYNAVSFIIGVDSIRNVSGAQSGALDPALDMFWTWNSGYVMAKLEGSSSFSSLVNHMIEYHIGGFKGTENVLKRVTMNFPSQTEVSEAKNLIVKLSADAKLWFENPHSLPISTNPTCTSPGTLARKFADNYANMFSVSSVVSE